LPYARKTSARFARRDRHHAQKPRRDGRIAERRSNFLTPQGKAPVAGLRLTIVWETKKHADLNYLPGTGEIG
jgi:hypothetical protein